MWIYSEKMLQRALTQTIIVKLHLLQYNIHHSFHIVYQIDQPGRNHQIDLKNNRNHQHFAFSADEPMVFIWPRLQLSINFINELINLKILEQCQTCEPR